MTVRARLTPHSLLSSPRRSPGVPNPAGTHVLYTLSTYSFDTHSKTVEFRLLTIETSESILLATTDAISSPVWVDDKRWLALKSSEDGGTDILCGAIDVDFKHAYTTAHIPAKASDLKIADLGDGKLVAVVSALQDKHGNLWDTKKKRETYSSGKVYDGLFVRHWDLYEGEAKNSLWYTLLSDKKNLEPANWHNALKGAPGLESPVKPFGGTDSFDVSKKGIVFVSKVPNKDPALNTTCGVYLLAISDFTQDAPEPERLDIFEDEGFLGAASNPVFTPNGEGLAFLKMKTNGYESDRNTIWAMFDVHAAGSKKVRNISYQGAMKSWDHSAGSLVWGPDRTLWITAEDSGYNKLYALSLNEEYPPFPHTVFSRGSVASVTPLPKARVFITFTTLTDPSTYGVISVRPWPLLASGNTTATTQWTHSQSHHGISLGLSASQVTSIFTPAANPKVNEKVHSWVVRPSFYEPKRRYPLALLIHGGPQGAWTDSWSTRWNPAVFAEQGYIVVAPNPTGSTGYGQAFTDAIRGDWGGAPYRDLVNVFEYVAKELPEVDTDNAVALGASYGGYMINWINGHELGRRFKALVCHDGIFSSTGLLGTEELYFPFYDLGGLPFYRPSSDKDELASQAAGDSKVTQVKRTFGTAALKTWEKNDPSRHLDKWDTPQLVIHSRKDYRLPISEGLAAFNVLQARGVESRFLTFPDENHWVLKPENSLLWHKVVLNWIGRYSGAGEYVDEGSEGEGFFGGVVNKAETRDGEKDDEKTEAKGSKKDWRTEQDLPPVVGEHPGTC